jgi:hypothetical protein
MLGIRLPEEESFLAQKLITDGSWFSHSIVHPDALQVTISAQQMRVQRIASLVGLVGKLHVARFTHVAINVVVLVHRDNSNSLIVLAIGQWRDA